MVKFKVVQLACCSNSKSVAVKQWSKMQQQKGMLKFFFWATAFFLTMPLTNAWIGGMGHRANQWGIVRLLGWEINVFSDLVWQMSTHAAIYAKILRRDKSDVWDSTGKSWMRNSDSFSWNISLWQRLAWTDSWGSKTVHLVDPMMLWQAGAVHTCCFFSFCAHTDKKLTKLCMVCPSTACLSMDKTRALVSITADSSCNRTEPRQQPAECALNQNWIWLFCIQWQSNAFSWLRVWLCAWLCLLTTLKTLLKCVTTSWNAWICKILKCLTLLETKWFWKACDTQGHAHRFKSMCCWNSLNCWLLLPSLETHAKQQRVTDSWQIVGFFSEAGALETLQTEKNFFCWSSQCFQLDIN